MKISTRTHTILRKYGTGNFPLDSHFATYLFRFTQTSAAGPARRGDSSPHKKNRLYTPSSRHPKAPISYYCSNAVNEGNSKEKQTLDYQMIIVLLDLTLPSNKFKKTVLLASVNTKVKVTITMLTLTRKSRRKHKIKQKCLN